MGVKFPEKKHYVRMSPPQAGGRRITVGFGLGLWVRFKMLGSDCNNRFPN